MVGQALIDGQVTEKKKLLKVSSVRRVLDDDSLSFKWCLIRKSAGLFLYNKGKDVSKKASLPLSCVLRQPNGDLLSYDIVPRFKPLTYCNLRLLNGYQLNQLMIAILKYFRFTDKIRLVNRNIVFYNLGYKIRKDGSICLSVFNMDCATWFTMDHLKTFLRSNPISGLYGTELDQFKSLMADKEACSAPIGYSSLGGLPDFHAVEKGLMVMKPSFGLCCMFF